MNEEILKAVSSYQFCIKPGKCSFCEMGGWTVIFIHEQNEIMIFFISGENVRSVLEFVFFPNRQLCIFLAAIHVCKNRLNASNSANYHAGYDPPSGFNNTWQKKWFPEIKYRFQDPCLGPGLKAKWEVLGTRLQHYLAVNLKGATMELNAHIGSPVWIISYHFTAISWGTLQTQKEKQKLLQETSTNQGVAN